MVAWFFTEVSEGETNGMKEMLYSDNHLSQ